MIKNFINLVQKQIIKNKLKSFNLYAGYEITDDLVVNFKSDLKLNGFNLKKIPFKIGIVNGDFSCSENKLKNLINGPKFVEGNYYCDNNRLTSLEGVAKIIPGTFDCSYNRITRLSEGPHQVGKTYRCSNNNLTTLHGIQQFIQGDFWCQNNQLKNLEFCPKIVHGFFNCEDNPIEEWNFLPNKVNIFLYTIQRNGPFGTLEELQKMNENEKIGNFYQEIKTDLSLEHKENNKKRLKI